MKLYNNLTNKEKGYWGESLACKDLYQKGFNILNRNFKSPYGEVDIILESDKELVFIEVKCWSFFGKSDLEYAINAKKRGRIIKTSLYFLEKNYCYQDYSLRYDIFLIQPANLQVFHIKNAFQGDGSLI